MCGHTIGHSPMQHYTNELVYIRLRVFMMVKNLMEGGCSVRCVQVVRKELRRIMAS